MTFNQLNLIKPLLENVEREGYSIPTAIQSQSIPHILQGKDLFGCAQTGTGKTAAFALPFLQLISHGKSAGAHPGITALVLAPTRELAIQIRDSFKTYGRGTGVSSTCIYGGVPQNPQVAVLQRGVDILIATPGRLLDLIQQRLVNLGHVKYFVLDEGDRMLDMGFIEDVKRIIRLLPEKRQTVLFSATITPAIRKLADTMMKMPVSVSVTPELPAASLVAQSVYFVKKENKRHLLNHVIQQGAVENALVFTRTKHGADKVARDLNKNGIRAESIHGNKSQTKRESTLKGFKDGRIRVLVATDLASRGIDIDRLSHVINYEIPESPTTYVHRIGRTGRAGVKGIALSFCSVDEKDYLSNISKLIRKEINIIRMHPFS